jgi:CII-binding regulator of phage lambda lysogenization HflD
MENICSFCSKSFTNITSLLRHQKTTKKCLAIQGKNDSVDCENCKKVLSLQSYTRHKIKCDQEYGEKHKLAGNLQEKNKLLEEKNKLLETQNKKMKNELVSLNNNLSKLKEELIESQKENEKLKTSVTLLERQNDKLHTSSTSITMKLAEKVNTVNHNHNNNNSSNTTVVIQTNQLTNEVLRQCAATFSMENARTIGGITRHLTTSLGNHVTCTDPSRSIFKYTNENDEEITDQNLEILLPQYLNAVKDRNNFFYKEVIQYFENNNMPLNTQTDYQTFYTALNSIIEKKGEQNKYTEKMKQKIVRECKRRFLEKNKNKETMLTKELDVEEVMINVIETGGSVHDFVDRYFGYDMDDDETDEQFAYRREMEDVFREKKRDWKNRGNSCE